ncbi:MAG: alpha/beta fold hydrolase [Armatimonadota bacterium]|nr:alpha/beta fold hydrolase [Armatimonadota bacterium]
MYVRVQGSGPRAFLAVHGWAGSHRDYAAIAAALPAGVRFARLDLPGHGRSPAPTSWTPEAIIHPILQAATELHNGPVTLVGFCSGAGLVALAAHQAPEVVARLVLIEPLFFVPWYFRLFTLGRFGAMAYGCTFASPRGRALTNGILRTRQRSEADFTAAFAHIDHGVALRYLRLFVTLPRPYRLPPPRASVDVCHGDHTFQAVRRSAALLQAAWPHTRVHRLHHSGHLPLRQAAAQIRQILFEGG